MATDVYTPILLHRFVDELMAGLLPRAVSRKTIIINQIDRELELAIAEGAQIRSTADFREGLTSFLEKRPPRWNLK